MSIDLNEEFLTASKDGSFEQVKLLLKQGANVDVCTSKGNTALMLAACYKSSIKIVRLLLECNANVNLINESGRTALMEACHNGYLEKVKLLLDKGADANVMDVSGSTAMMHASCQGFDAIVILLDHGVFVNVQGDYGDTALIYACNVGSLEMRNGDIIVRHDRYIHCFKVAQLLLKHGADTTIVNKKDKTALMAAYSRKAWAIVTLLSDHIEHLKCKKN